MDSALRWEESRPHFDAELLLHRAVYTPERKRPVIDPLHCRLVLVPWPCLKSEYPPSVLLLCVNSVFFCRMPCSRKRCLSRSCCVTWQCSLHLPDPTRHQESLKHTPGERQIFGIYPFHNAFVKLRPRIQQGDRRHARRFFRGVR